MRILATITPETAWGEPYPTDVSYWQRQIEDARADLERLVLACRTSSDAIRLAREIRGLVSELQHAEDAALGQADALTGE